MEQEKKWTPGNWHAHADDLTVLATDDEIVADVYGGNCALANAHLIAAAPELYKALEQFVYHYPYGIIPLLDEAAEKARAALAKARGEQC